MILREIRGRITRVRGFMERRGLKALLITNPKNVFYLTGKETGRVLIEKNTASLWVKELYREIDTEFYEQEGYPLKVHSLEKNIIKRYLKKRKLKELGVENLRIKSFKNLKKELKVKLVSTDVLRRVRTVKSAYEIEQLKKAAEIARLGMEEAYQVIHGGVREIDAVAEIEAQIRKLGSEEPPFGGGALLSSGKNSANIHALSGNKKIKKNSLVVVDLGAKINGYYSDMTRTIKLGKLKKRDEKIFDFVRELELRAIGRVKEGMKAKEIHDFVEKEIQKRGYKFYHNTGHGIGLEVHELPNLGPDSEDVIQEGMVFTIEPGIYLPGKFGVRFEDTILLRNGKVEILTK